MRTSIITAAVLFLHINLISQNYLVASNNYGPNELGYNTYHITVSDTYNYSSFTYEVIAVEDFEYRQFLREAKVSNKNYGIGEKQYNEVELAKVFRKGARKSENTAEFITFLKKENPNLISNLSEDDLNTLFKQFRTGTFHEYLDDLAEAF